MDCLSVECLKFSLFLRYTIYLGGFCVSNIRRAFGSINFVIKVVAPIIVYVTCNALILRRIKQQSRVNIAMATITSVDISTSTAAGKTTKRQDTKPATLTSSDERKEGRRKRGAYSRMRKNVAMTLLYTLAVHVIALTGNQTLIIAGVFGSPPDTTSLLFQILRLMTYIGACTNPFIYVIKYERFRAAVIHCGRMIRSTFFVSIRPGIH
jgi:hypothetical protein